MRRRQEGLVSKHRVSRYQAGRFDRWVKAENRQHSMRRSAG
jgi:ATP-dependent DNA ligase